MPTPEAPLPETAERLCPVCPSVRIPDGHIIAEDGFMKVKCRCDSCGAGFLFMRKSLV